MSMLGERSNPSKLKSESFTPLDKNEQLALSCRGGAQAARTVILSAKESKRAGSEA